MKIYNEITSRFNEITGKWETISEDSFEYNGAVALAQGVPPNSSPINTSDTIADTIKTTAGYFTGGDGTLKGFDCNTGSYTDESSKYYVNVSNFPVSSGSSLQEDQFSITFGHVNGLGSDVTGDSAGNTDTLKGETEAIYTQLAEILLHENEVTGGFKIGTQGSDLANNTLHATGSDAYIYALIGKRSLFKDRMNKKVWTLSLQGYTGSAEADGQLPSDQGRLHLTDDSKDVAPVATPAGPRYNIVSGTLGNVVVGYATKTYGHFYPEMGMMVFSGAQLSASMPGKSSFQTQRPYHDDGYTSGHPNTGDPLIAANTHLSSSGFHPLLSTTGSGHNHLRLLNCMRNMGDTTSLRLRSEEDATEENYFCRIKAEEYNFSSNHTFVSGSKNKIRNANMHGNPTTFITGVGLYNSAGQLLAIAKLSKPLIKNFATEATIKVKLTY